MGICLASPILRSQAGETKFDVEGVKNVECACIVATSGCRSRILDGMAGKVRHTWIQEIHVARGMSLDLTDVCYRKRDADKMGEGLCCAADKEADTITKFFYGKLQ